MIFTIYYTVATIIFLIMCTIFGLTKECMDGDERTIFCIGTALIPTLWPLILPIIVVGFSVYGLIFVIGTILAGLVRLIGRLYYKQ